MSPLKWGGPELTGTSGMPRSLARLTILWTSSAVLGLRTHCGLILWAKLRSTEYCSSTSGSQLILRAPSTPDSVDRGTILTSWMCSYWGQRPLHRRKPAEPPRSHLAALGLAAGSARSYWGSAPPPQAERAASPLTPRCARPCRWLSARVIGAQRPLHRHYLRSLQLPGLASPPPEAKPPEPPPSETRFARLEPPPSFKP